uniref:Uncharacterized protein n=2 Tax=Thermoanaerobacterium thermosaccharolyticum TaxID=1517 RepID=Q52235_THETR|nr:unknown [Thermoanaerobacterium thermosaccharolyticum]prf//1906306C ORF 3 in plasmid pNB2 [Thermoanaerobacterium thermosaccharolyticum]
MINYKDVIKNYIRDYMQADFLSFVSDNSISFLKVITARIKKDNNLYDVTFTYDDLNKKDLVIQEVVRL